MMSRQTRRRVGRGFRIWRFDLVAIMAGALVIYLVIAALHHG
jgi:hypothetical protein